jgi:hypothetical protein
MKRLFWLVVITDIAVYLGWSVLVLFAVLIPFAWVAGFLSVIWLHRHGYMKYQRESQPTNVVPFRRDR